MTMLTAQDWANCLYADPSTRCVCSCGGEHHGEARTGVRQERQVRRYTLMVCANCRHPGGVHIIDQWEPRITHCRYCTDCPGWADGPYAEWSDEMTRQHLLPTPGGTT